VTRQHAHPPVRVLIVEDDPRVRTALRRFLSTADDIEVIADAGATAPALRLAHDLTPTVALVDVHLPHPTDGLELLRELTALGIPTVAISIHSWLRTKALAAGAHQFLDKETAPDLMLTALRQAAQHPPTTSIRRD
jgi:DNA-binding NarL/FixJ family response regulator